MSSKISSQFPESAEDFRRLFEAAKHDGMRQVADGEGVFTISYAKRAKSGSAREFLTAGGPAEE